MTQRKIIHIDCDCFYAAIEMRDDPRLAGKPLAVGGSADRRGVIATCNYEARAYGVRSAMSSRHALKLCPDLLIVKPRFEAYREAMAKLNTLPPSIEPTASGHIIEQINMTQAILDAGLAYVVDGSVYFDVLKYNEQHHYGKLSGRVVEELQASERELEGQDIKRNKADFALWKKAEPQHIMRWPSPS